MVTLFQICTNAIQSNDVPTAKEYFSLLQSRGQASLTAANMLRIAIVEFQIMVHNGDIDSAEKALRTCLTRQHSLDHSSPETREYIRLLSSVALEVCDLQSKSLAKTCLRRIVDEAAAAKDYPEGLYIDKVFNNYVNIVSSVDKEERPSPAEDLSVLAQGLRIIDRFGVQAFCSDDAQRIETLKALAGVLKLASKKVRQI